MSGRPLHVLMVSDVYFPRINGVSTSIATFRRDLAEQGLRVTLVAPHYPAGEADEPGLSDRETLRVHSRRIPFDPEDRLMGWQPLRQALDHASRHSPVDLIHVQTPFAAHLAGFRHGRKTGVPVVATYHTHFEEYIAHYLPLLPRPALKALARQIARSQCNGLHGVIVPSGPMRDTLKDYGITAPMHVLPTGIVTGHFNQGQGARFRQRHGIGAERKVALFVGRTAHEKNIDVLIHAAARIARVLPEFLLIIAGEGPALPRLKKLAADLNLAGHVQFVGYLPRQTELPDCYAAADVFAFSSLTETQGLVVLEAMAAGVPVYAIPAMGVGEIIAPSCGAVHAPREPAAFAAGLAALLRDRPRLAQLATEAKFYAETWSAPERARQLSGLYRQVINDNGKSPKLS